MDVTRCDYSGATLFLYTQFLTLNRSVNTPFWEKGNPLLHVLVAIFPYKEISTPIWGKRAISGMFVKEMMLKHHLIKCQLGCKSAHLPIQYI